jgi:glycosidase
MTTPLTAPPTWVRDAVFYQIFPDRFAISDRVEKPGGLEPWDSAPTPHGYKGGDLLGIAERLDHLVDLGITAIYLNPIFQGAANHRYHTHDYYQVDPLLGGNAAFEALVAACHHRNIRVVLDGVFNHSSRGFFMFHDVLENGANSPWLDWFHIHEWPLNPYGKKPANYGAWWGLKALPTFNTDNPEVREYLMRIGEYWARQGIDGWRLDVPEEIHTPGFWEEFRQRVRAVNPNLYIVGEIWSDAADYIADGTRFDGTMNYRLTTAILSYVIGHRADDAAVIENEQYVIDKDLDAVGYADRIDALLASYPEHAHLANLNLLDSHDTARIMSVASNDVPSVELALTLLLTFPGAPSIYYGTEVGLEGFPDPDCRRSMPWDEARWNTDLLETTRQLIALRREHPALRSADYRRVDTGVDASMVTVFSRHAEDETLVVAVNAGDEDETVRPRVEFGAGLQAIWGEASAADGVFFVPARSAVIWQVG